MERELLRKVQLTQLEIAKEIRRVCEENDIPYFLTCGTLLGAVRHQGFIPWDDDLDVALLRPDYERLLALDDGCWGEKYFLQREFSPHWPLHFPSSARTGPPAWRSIGPRMRGATGAFT